jgi:sugar/nucleoside kinase (ribokinase family)
MKTRRIVVVGSVNTDMVIQVGRIPALGETVTGVALILVDRKGQNLIAFASGANAAVARADAHRAADRICAAQVLLLQLEIPLDAVAYAARVATQSGVPVILNPAPAAPLPRGLLRLLDCITPNETEAERLTGIAVTDRRSAEAAARRLLKAGGRKAILTLGARGALLAVALASGLKPADTVRRACLVGPSRPPAFARSRLSQPRTRGTASPPPTARTADPGRRHPDGCARSANRNARRARSRAGAALDERIQEPYGIGR